MKIDLDAEELEFILCFLERAEKLVSLNISWVLGSGGNFDKEIDDRIKLYSLIKKLRNAT